MDAGIAHRRGSVSLGDGFESQVVARMIYFLRMNTRAEGGWTIRALIFTLALVVMTLTAQFA